MIGRKTTRKSWIRVVMLAAGIGAACLVMSAPGYAQRTDYVTIVNFSAPVEVPGTDPQVLPAGTYTLKVVDSKVNPNIVQISNMDDTHVFTTVLTVPAHREVDTDKTVITFAERGAGQPQAIQAWFYPHEKMGQEFVYSHAATELPVSQTVPASHTPLDALVG